MMSRSHSRRVGATAAVFLVTVFIFAQWPALVLAEGEIQAGGSPMTAGAAAESIGRFFAADNPDLENLQEAAAFLNQYQGRFDSSDLKPVADQIQSSYDELASMSLKILDSVKKDAHPDAALSRRMAKKFSAIQVLPGRFLTKDQLAEAAALENQFHDDLTPDVSAQIKAETSQWAKRHNPPIVMEIEREETGPHLSAARRRLSPAEKADILAAWLRDLEDIGVSSELRSALAKKLLEPGGARSWDLMMFKRQRRMRYGSISQVDERYDFIARQITQLGGSAVLITLFAYALVQSGRSPLLVAALGLNAWVGANLFFYKNYKNNLEAKSAANRAADVAEAILGIPINVEERIPGTPQEIARAKEIEKVARSWQELKQRYGPLDTSD